MSSPVRTLGIRLVAAAAAAVCLGTGLADSWAKDGRGGAVSATTELTPPRGTRLPRARGAITARVGDDGREILTVRLRGLRRGETCTLLCDDPRTPSSEAVEFAAVKIGRGRAALLRIDSRDDGFMPSDATIDELAGRRFEVRDTKGSLVLSGGMPDPRGVAAAAPPGCRFLEDVVLADAFDSGTAGAAPANWDVAGTEVVIDDTVRAGTTGASVRIADTDAVTGAPEMARTFASQDRFFAVEFTLIASATSGRTVFRLGEGASPTTFATGFGDGLGFYENGTIGFGTADTIRTVTPGTAYRFRVDVDLDADLFDVAIDGTTVVTDRALGFTGASLDRIVFGGAASTTGTANVDDVSVVTKSLDCAPTANAGPDQVVEATGPTTTVTLDGTASADPEGAALTYTWTGPFAGGTATGATPSVQFTGLGTFTVSLVVNDGFFDSPADTAVVEVRDTTPPVLTVTGLPTELWPPNHQLIAIHPTVTATDLVDPDPVVTLTITSNEPDDGTGDGSTSGDFAIRTPSDFDLRAERSGPGSGRIYRLTWTATDDSGNSTSVTREIVVPHDRGNGNSNGNGNGNSGGNGNSNGNGNGNGNGRGRPVK